jgi:hypothetical protein
MCFNLENKEELIMPLFNNENNYIYTQTYYSKIKIIKIGIQSLLDLNKLKLLKFIRVLSS